MQTHPDIGQQQTCRNLRVSGCVYNEWLLLHQRVQVFDQGIKTREKIEALIEGGGGYIHIFRFCATRFF